MPRRMCVDLGAFQGVCCNEHFHSFSPLFLYLWNLLPYEAELIVWSVWLLLLDVGSASKETRPPTHHGVQDPLQGRGMGHW